MSEEVKSTEVEADNKVYLVVADTYRDSYGCEMSLFGVYNKVEDLEKRCKKLKKQGLNPLVIEAKVGEDVEKYIGGYYE
jgi:hypothetical protein